MSCCLASQLSCCVFIKKYKYIPSQLVAYLSSWGLPTLAVPYNKIFPIQLAFDFKKLEIICKPRRMKCFKTILSNSFFPPRLMFLQLARLGFMFTCSQSTKTNILLCLIKSTVIGYYSATTSLYLHYIATIFVINCHIIYKLLSTKKHSYLFYVEFSSLPISS